MTRYLWIIGCIATIVYGESFLADVNHDGVDDEVIWGKNSVVVVDGASGKREVVRKGSSISPGEGIEEVSPIHLGSEIGLKILESWYGYKRGGVTCLIYLYDSKQKKWIEVYSAADELYCINELSISHPEVGRLYYTTWNRPLLYWNDSTFVELEIKYKKEEKEVKVNPGNNLKIPFVVLEDEVLVLTASLKSGGGGITTSSYDIKTMVYNNKGLTYFNEVLQEGESIESSEGIPLVIIPEVEEWEESGEPLTVYLLFDNTSATFSYKNVSYSGIVYKIKKK